ncbi:Mu transposase domain-containing protein [Corynebacterium mayonis]|uniref:Mu transposase domain-containing protein n=1 Tax=Corynebacterium mayonis TaxID=3062461 RepID=UPI0031403183
MPTRPAKPRDKAAVERAVKTVYSLVLGYFDNQCFYSLEELNEAISRRVDDINEVRARTDGVTRRDLFDADERPLMRALPDDRFTEVLWRSLKVDRSWHVTCDYQYYSVPFTLVGKMVRARLTQSMVSIFYNDELVAEHPRLHGFRYRYSSDPAHSPDGSSTSKAYTRDELLSWASSYGTATMEVIKKVLDRFDKAVPKGMKQASLILVTLGKRHNGTTLEPACQYILDKQLAPARSVIQRVQSNIHQNRPTASPGDTATAPGRGPIDLTGLESEVFIRSAEHFTEGKHKHHD